MSELINVFFAVCIIYIIVGAFKPSAVPCRGPMKSRQSVLTFYGLSLLALVIVSNTIKENDREINEKISPQSAAKSSGNDNGEKSSYGKVGQEITVGNLTYLVSSVEFSDSIRGPLNIEHADGIFVIIKILIKNNGKSTKTIDGSMFTLADENHNAYEMSNKFLLSEYQERMIFLKQVHPNIVISGIIGFEVPTKGLHYGLALPEKNASGKHVFININ